MNKKSVDGNLEKALANLESHPALLKRCQQLYLEKVIESKTCVELAEEHRLNVSTVSRYIEAYRKVAERYSDTPTIGDILAFCNAEIRRLLEKREGTKSVRDYKDLTSEARQFMDMIGEISGLVSRKAEININFINNTISVITNELPTLLEQHLPTEIANNILLALAEKLEESTKG